MIILIEILNIIGVVSFAAAGAMIAIDKEADIFGVMFLSVVTCFGGGMLRDAMISEGLPRFFYLLWPDVVVCLVNNSHSADADDFLNLIASVKSFSKKFIHKNHPFSALFVIGRLNCYSCISI